MTNLRSILMAGAASLIVVTGAQAADRPLSGTITSASGQKLEGVTVSAKQEGSTITTSVYTDGTGNYYFPLLPSGRYQRLGAGARLREARSSVDLSAGRRQNLVLQPITDPERRIRQLPSELLVAALPEGTEDDARMKKSLHEQLHRVPCAGLRPAIPFRSGRVEQGHRPDESRAGHRGVPRAEHKSQPDPRPQPAGAGGLPVACARAGRNLDEVRPASAADGRSGARRVDALRSPAQSRRRHRDQYNDNDGTDWALGTTSKLGQMPHDGGMGLDGTLYFTVNNPNTLATIGRVDPKTGQRFLPESTRGERPGGQRPRADA